MKKILGIAGLLLAVFLATSVLAQQPDGSNTFLTAYNLENLLQRVGMYGVLSIAAAFVIVTGGIDLSIGSVVCVAGCSLPHLVATAGMSPWAALPLVLALSAAIGLWHGFLVVVVRLQPFVVTLCGLLLYRGLMRKFTNDATKGFGSGFDDVRWIATGRVQLTESFGVPVAFLVMTAVAVLAAVFLNRTVWGRHLFALGRNEEAARFSGVATGRLTVLAYVLCSLLAGLAGCLFVLDVNSARASDFGNFYELYAIAGAVLGGVALRGGEGSVLGVVLGASLMRVLAMAINIVADSNQLEFAIVGAVILAGAAADEGVRSLLRRRR
jgi:ribose transport system permease protein